jgi:hypothetical protein
VGGVLAVVGVLSAALAGSRVTAASAAAVGNPVQVENSRRGTSSWRWPQAPARAVEGYASEVSVLPGGSLSLHVSTVPAALVQPAFDPATGYLDAGWPVTDTIRVGSGWVSGYYLADLVLTSGPFAGKAGWVPFIVREPSVRPLSNTRSGVCEQDARV